MKTRERRVKVDSRILKPLIEKIDADAEATSRTRSNMIECIIKEHYEKKEKKNRAGLTIKQETFVQEYMKDGDASRAYREAYDSSLMKSTTITNSAYKLLKNGVITARIETLRNALEKKNEVTREKVLKEYSKIAFLDATKLFDEFGNLKALHEIDEDTRAAISNIEVSTIKVNEAVQTSIHKVKLSDKKLALDSIAKMQGYNIEKPADSLTEQKIEVIIKHVSASDRSSNT